DERLLYKMLPLILYGSLSFGFVLEPVPEDSSGSEYKRDTVTRQIVEITSSHVIFHQLVTPFS
ncbi:MAG: hypothetical protein QF442_03805, partial [Candidatus Peribacteraceae bacterium]|nr:hypothetical protein [Candidatus Peribacteraceae bacterium]